MKKNFKDLNAVLLTLIIFFMCTTTVFSADYPVIKISDISGKVGDEITVTASIENNPGIAGYKFRVIYNPDKFEYIGGEDIVAIGERAIISLYLVNDNKLNNSVVIVALRSTDSNADGLLFTLKFKIKDNGIEDTDLRLIYTRDIDISNESGKSVNPEIEQSVINVPGDINENEEDENNDGENEETEENNNPEYGNSQPSPAEPDEDETKPSEQINDENGNDGTENDNGNIEFEATPQQNTDGTSSSSVSIPVNTFRPSETSTGTNETGETVEVKSELSNYVLPANIESIIPNFADYKNVAAVKITINDNTAKSERIDGALSGIVEFKLELSDINGTVIAEISDFGGKLEKVIPLLKNAEKPEYWGVLTRINNKAAWGFVPAKWIDSGVSVLNETTGEYVVVAYNPSFTDVTKEKWYYENVTMAASKLLVKGMNESGTVYNPENQVTRAEFITMIVRALRLPEVQNSGAVYSDVNISDWFYNDIVKAESAGLISLLGESEFKPNQAINREEMAYVLAKAAEYCKIKSTGKIELGMRFTDSAAIDVKYAQFVETTVSLQLMQGMSAETFEGKGTVTRAQAATVLVNMCKIFDWID